MPSPQPYFDDDRPARGSARLYGDMAGLRGVPTSALRGSDRTALTPRQRRMKRKHIIIFLARINGLSLSVIGDAFDLTPQQISKICQNMGYDEL